MESKEIFRLFATEDGKPSITHVKDMFLVMDAFLAMAISYKFLYELCRYVVFNLASTYEKGAVLKHILAASEAVTKANVKEEPKKSPLILPGK